MYRYKTTHKYKQTYYHSPPNQQIPIDDTHPPHPPQNQGVPFDGSNPPPNENDFGSNTKSQFNGFVPPHSQQFDTNIPTWHPNGMYMPPPSQPVNIYLLHPHPNGINPLAQQNGPYPPQNVNDIYPTQGPSGQNRELAYFEALLKNPVPPQKLPAICSAQIDMSTTIMDARLEYVSKLALACATAKWTVRDEVKREQKAKLFRYSFVG
jgi:hypothetical protein